MLNPLFEAVLREKDPMYDCAVITEKGTEYWKYPDCNYANNSHSVTKLFVCTAVGILSEQGKINIKDSVTSFFDASELPAGMDSRWHSVTVEQTMQHKTGMDTIPFNVDNDDDLEKIGPDFLKYVFSLPIEHEPGTYRRYSDEAFYLLIRIISKAAGENAEEFFRKNLMGPLGFRQWSMAKCPMGYPIGGGGFYCRSDDAAKLGFTYAMGGVFEGKRIISEQWVKDAMALDYACTRHRDSSVFVKTGAKGQMVAFSVEKKVAAAWHGCSDKDGNERNNRLLDGFLAYIDAMD